MVRRSLRGFQDRHHLREPEFMNPYKCQVDQFALYHSFNMNLKKCVALATTIHRAGQLAPESKASKYHSLSARTAPCYRVPRVDKALVSRCLRDQHSGRLEVAKVVQPETHFQGLQRNIAAQHYKCAVDAACALYSSAHQD